MKCCMCKKDVNPFSPINGYIQLDVTSYSEVYSSGIISDVGECRQSNHVVKYICAKCLKKFNELTGN